MGQRVLRPQGNDLHLLMAIAMGLGFAPHFFMMIFGKDVDEFHPAYHDCESIPGYILVGLRLFMYVLFLFAMRFSIEDADGPDAKQFYKKFRDVGSVYYMMYSAVWFMTEQFSPWWRQSVLTFGLMILQLG